MWSYRMWGLQSGSGGISALQPLPIQLQGWINDKQEYSIAGTKPKYQCGKSGHLMSSSYDQVSLGAHHDQGCLYILSPFLIIQDRKYSFSFVRNKKILSSGYSSDLANAIWRIRGRGRTEPRPCEPKAHTSSPPGWPNSGELKWDKVGIWSCSCWWLNLT